MILECTKRIGSMNSQKQELRESGLFRQKALDRFLNGMEPDAPMLLQARPWKMMVGAVLSGVGVLLLWMFI